MSNSDWELVNFNNKIPNISKNISEWERYSPENKENDESFLTSLGLAPFRIAGDIGTSLYDTAKKIPEYYEKGKNELSGLPTTIAQHPLHALGQIGAGSQEAVNSLAQLPLNLSQYGSERLHLLPKNVTETISRFTPQDTSQAINELFGKPKYAGEELLRGTVANAPQLIGGTKIATTLNPMRLTDKNIIKDILKEKGKMEEKYSGEKGLYKSLFKEARDRGMGNVNANIKDIHILRQFTPDKKLHGVNEFINNNTIENAQKALGDLGHIERTLEKKTSLTDAESEQLKAAKSAKEEIQLNMFTQQIHPDLPDLLHSDLFTKHKKIQTGYAKENVPYTKNIAIKKYLNNDITEDQLLESLKKGQFAAKVGDRHLLNTKAKLLKAAGAGTIGGLGLYGYEKLKDLLMNENKT
jgi:hypothetical protein